VGQKPQTRQGTGHNSAPLAVRPRRRGDRVTPSTARRADDARQHALPWRATADRVVSQRCMPTPRLNRPVTSDALELERLPNSPEYLTFAEQQIASWQYIAQKIKSASNGC